MLENLTKLDIGILVAAAVMALGAFCPIVHLPIVGSMNYVMGGRGDGIYVVGCFAAIVLLILNGYRRTTGILAAVALFLMLTALIQFSVKLSQAHAGLRKDNGPFSGLGEIIAQSIGLEWGWLLMIGGALGVVVLALMIPGDVLVPASARSEPQHKGEESFSSADKIITDYLENRKISPAIRNQSAPQQSSFGKRRGA